GPQHEGARVRRHHRALPVELAAAVHGQRRHRIVLAVRALTTVEDVLGREEHEGRVALGRQLGGLGGRLAVRLEGLVRVFFAVVYEGEPGRAEDDVGRDVAHDARGGGVIPHVELKGTRLGHPIVGGDGGVAAADEGPLQRGTDLTGAADDQSPHPGVAQPSDSRGDGPPSTMIVSPVMKEDASEARKMQGYAISSTRPQRPIATRAATARYVLSASGSVLWRTSM